jgi:hypothetical protein
MRSTSQAASFSLRHFIFSSRQVLNKSSQAVFALASRHATRMCALALLMAGLQCSGAFAQGFSGAKKTITLQRKLPAVVRLPGTAIDIQPADRNQGNGDVAQALLDMLLVTLQKNDTRLHADKNSPDAVITYSIITYETPPPTNYTRQEPQYQNKRLIQVPVQYSKVTGELTIAYRAMDARKKTLDAGSITIKYSQDFQVGEYQAVNQIGGESVGPFTSKINPFSLGKKKPEENPAPPTPVQVRQKLLDGVVSQLAARFVNTQENVEVMLAKGKPLDNANSLAEKAQWTRCLELLETMNPLPNPADDAYRLYNIGVANEALAYQSEDKVTVQKFLQEAAIMYGKAIDAKLSEKYFADPQTRIEVAVAHYKKLSEGPNTTEETAARSNAPAAAKGSVPAAEGNSTPTGSKTARGTTNSAPPPLANADIIKMAKAGVDEESIIASIQDAANVDFAFSPDDLIALASAGVKGKIVGAMRLRAKQPQRHAASPRPH